MAVVVAAVIPTQLHPRPHLTTAGEAAGEAIHHPPRPELILGTATTTMTMERAGPIWTTPVAG